MAMSQLVIFQLKCCKTIFTFTGWFSNFLTHCSNDMSCFCSFAKYIGDTFVSVVSTIVLSIFVSGHSCSYLSNAFISWSFCCLVVTADDWIFWSSMTFSAYQSSIWDWVFGGKEFYQELSLLMGFLYRLLLWDLNKMGVWYVSLQL